MTSSEGGGGRVPTKTLLKYDAFLERLQADLTKTTKTRDRSEARRQEFEALEVNLENLQKENLKELRTRVDLGAGVSMQAEVADTSRIFVDAGLGFHVECDWEEGLRVAKLRKEHFQSRVETYTEKIANITAHMRLISQALLVARNDGLTDTETGLFSPILQQTG